ncbi:hypothetical protein apy_03150 [Aeropyrum pernix]|uniref:Uncharacterized protein n=1 Tax=Aeropyrum pernix TaxID=56636 RepID=A0A401H877_AERPX|nr:hypothetical protein [Aeropyrum pernix]GBF08590.1 hypothetical protein apy_03150 [Aeropyrum pernix]
MSYGVAVDLALGVIGILMIAIVALIGLGIILAPIVQAVGGWDVFVAYVKMTGIIAIITLVGIFAIMLIDYTLILGGLFLVFTGLYALYDMRDYVGLLFLVMFGLWGLGMTVVGMKLRAVAAIMRAAEDKRDEPFKVKAGGYVCKCTLFEDPDEFEKRKEEERRKKEQEEEEQSFNAQ